MPDAEARERIREAISLIDHAEILTAELIELGQKAEALGIADEIYEHKTWGPLGAQWQEALTELREVCDSLLLSVDPAYRR